MRLVAFLFTACFIVFFHLARSYSGVPSMFDASSLIDADILPIKPLEPLFPPGPLSLHSILLVALIAVVSLVVIIASRKNRKKPHPFQTNRCVIPPYQEALDALQRLEHERCHENAKVKSGYGALSKILRTYLSRSLNIPAGELTTDEMRRLLHIEGGQWNKALPFMEAIDIAKFSNSVCSTDEYETIVKEMKTFVLKTRRNAAEEKSHV